MSLEALTRFFGCNLYTSKSTTNGNVNKFAFTLGENGKIRKYEIVQFNKQDVVTIKAKVSGKEHQICLINGEAKKILDLMKEVQFTPVCPIKPMRPVSIPFQVGHFSNGICVVDYLPPAALIPAILDANREIDWRYTAQLARYNRDHAVYQARKAEHPIKVRELASTIDQLLPQ